jgi:Transglycosylase SLT domain
LAFAGGKMNSAVCERHLSAASKAEGVPVGLLYAVALAETGSSGRLSPYALNIEGEPFVASTRREALVVFEAARKNEKVLIDLGCMQINYLYHRKKFRAASDMLDPRLNVNYAAKLLKTLRIRHGSWMEAVARYHASPRNKVAQHRYVCRVIRNLVQTNFGGWTPAAKSYCNRESK